MYTEDLRHFVIEFRRLVRQLSDHLQTQTGQHLGMKFCTGGTKEYKSLSSNLAFELGPNNAFSNIGLFLHMYIAYPILGISRGC